MQRKRYVGTAIRTSTQSVSSCERLLTLTMIPREKQDNLDSFRNVDRDLGSFSPLGT